MESETAIRTRSQWRILPPDSTIEFTVGFRSMTTATGCFRKFEGVIDFDEVDSTRSSVHMTIDAASIDTGDPTRDAHLRSPDFLDVQHYPTLTFTSRHIVAREQHLYDVHGDLTIRGVIHETTLQVAFIGETIDYLERRRASFSGKTTIEPSDFGVDWNRDLSAGWIPIGDQVTVTIDVEAIAAT